MKFLAKGNVVRALWDWGAAALLLLLPFLVFLRHNDYGILSPEIATCTLLILLAGFFWSLLMGLGQAVRIVVTTFLIVLLIDVQTEWLTTVGLRLLLNVIGFGLLCWLMRRVLSRAVVVVVAAMTLATILQPPGSPFRAIGPSNVRV